MSEKFGLDFPLCTSKGTNVASYMLRLLELGAVQIYKFTILSFSPYFLLVNFSPSDLFGIHVCLIKVFLTEITRISIEAFAFLLFACRLGQLTWIRCSTSPRTDELIPPPAFSTYGNLSKHTARIGLCVCMRMSCFCYKTSCF